MGRRESRMSEQPPCRCRGDYDSREMVGVAGALTTAGFIALTTLLLGVAAGVASVMVRNAVLRERIATLEEKIGEHLKWHERSRERKTRPGP